MKMTRTRRIPSLPILVLAFCFLPAFNALAQYQLNLEEKPAPDWKQKLFYGGSLGLQFGTVTLIDISPMAGYRLTPRIGVGISPTYKYYKYKNYYGSSYDLKSHVFGGGIFTRILILDNLFAHAEYEYLTYKTKDSYTSGTYYYKEYNSVLIGAGYREQIAENAFMYLAVLWNLNETLDSPYSNPIFRAGFSVGF